MKFNLNENIKFSKFSGDLNQIHVDKKQAAKFFIKKPIVHGANVLIKAFNQKKFLENKFNCLEIKFKDFININENFTILQKKNFLTIKGSFNNKIEISKKFQRNKLAINKKEIINELLFISKYVGNISPGRNSLIQQINFNYLEKYYPKKIIKKRKVNKNVLIINYYYKNLNVEVTALKLYPFSEARTTKILKSKKIINLIKNKKIIIYGKNSDFGNFIYNSNIKKYCKIYLISSKNIKEKSLKKSLKIIKPDFIFYFFSPKIISGESKQLYKRYSDIYLNIPKLIFKINSRYKKKFKIFYPSTFFINIKKDYKYLKSYIDAKQNSEKEFKKDYYKNKFYIIRLPQIKTRSNYSPLLGVYLGKNLNYLSREIENFIKISIT